MATLDRRVRQAGRSKLPQLVLGMSPNVGACLQGVAASLWPAFFLSLNSVGIRQIGLLMSFVCCQPEWSVGSGSLGPNWKSKQAVWLVDLPSWLSSAPSSSPPASLCVTKADCLPRAVPLLPNKGAPPPECPQAR